ncbi:MAG: RNA polymerase sigma-70 factor [Bacteroidota bacterium]
MSFFPVSTTLPAGRAQTEEGTFRKLFDAYSPGLLRSAERTLNCPHEAKEVVMDVFTKLWKQRHELTVHGSTTAYLRSAVRNRCIDYLRRRNRQRNVTADLPLHRPCPCPTPDQQTAANQLSLLIEAAISDLPPRGQEIFRLNRFEGMTYQQIADSRGLSPKTVETHMRRNLIFLRNRLQQFTEISL